MFSLKNLFKKTKLPYLGMICPIWWLQYIFLFGRLKQPLRKHIRDCFGGSTNKPPEYPVKQLFFLCGVTTLNMSRTCIFFGGVGWIFVFWKDGISPKIFKLNLEVWINGLKIRRASILFISLEKKRHTSDLIASESSTTRGRWVCIFYWVVASICFYFHPYLRRIPILTNIFRRGWNHQLEYLSFFFFGGESWCFRTSLDCKTSNFWASFPDNFQSQGC